MIESKAKISIIIPVYKVEKYLLRCLNSIRNQTFHDFECILIDDGSPDSCGNMCDKYASEDRRFKVIHKSNGGLSSARNTGLEMVQSKYVTFVDSDDVLHPQMIERLFAQIIQCNADIAASRWEYFSTWEAPIKQIENINFMELSKDDFIAHLYPDNINKISITACGKIYKSEIFQTIHFPEKLVYEDLRIFLQVLLSCQKIVISSEPLYFYFYNPDSITMSNYLTHDRFGEFQVREGYIDFFAQRGLHEQAQLAQNDYLTFFMRNYFAVMLRYPQREQALKPHVARFRKHLRGILSNPYVCRMRKICAAGMLICPRVVYPVARRCIPDCLIEEMR